MKQTYIVLAPVTPKGKFKVCASAVVNRRSTTKSPSAPPKHRLIWFAMHLISVLYVSRRPNRKLRQREDRDQNAGMATANIVWPIEPPKAPTKDTTKEKNGAGNNKK